MKLKTLCTELLLLFLLFLLFFLNTAEFYLKTCQQVKNQSHLFRLDEHGSHNQTHAKQRMRAFALSCKKKKKDMGSSEWQVIEAM
jgi:hypothetical protein